MVIHKNILTIVQFCDSYTIVIENKLILKAKIRLKFLDISGITEGILKK